MTLVGARKCIGRDRGSGARLQAGEDGWWERHEETGEARLVTWCMCEIKDEAQTPTGVIQWSQAPSQASSDMVGIGDAPYSFT